MMNRIVFCVAFAFVPGQTFGADEKNRDTHENLNSVLWMQTSVEYQMAVVSAYRNARGTVASAIADRGWTAALEQSNKEYANLPPAIIVDIDETVLDNSRSQAQTVIDRGVFDVTETEWNNWVGLADASPVPGAVEFLNWAIWQFPQTTIFYVTNRAANVEAKTRENLKKHGFPLKEGVDVVVTKGELGSTSSDKSSRRAKISETYRVILLVGDDLGDFMSAQGSPDERLAAARANQQYWGERWVVLPNPTYGSWERALYPNGSKDEDALKSKFDKLKTIR